MVLVFFHVIVTDTLTHATESTKDTSMKSVRAAQFFDTQNLKRNNYIVKSTAPSQFEKSCD